MTSAAVAVLQARATAIDFATLDDAPSDLAGWSRLDIGRHLTDLCERVVGPARRPSRDDDTVARADAGVAAMAGIDGEDVGIRYADASGAMIGHLDRAQVPVAGDLLVHFGTAGQHPTHLWADGLVYEHAVHAGIDLGLDAWALDADVAGPALGWVVSSLPQVHTDRLLAVLTEPFAVSIAAPVDVDMTLWPVGDAVGIGVGSAPSARAAVAMTPEAMVAMVSGRGSPGEGAPVQHLTGDESFARRVLDEMRI